ncbi:hypothetical protein EON63_16720 [archaeon]|nr:MAG: hypothetical protein EON63_16720 [archaeon]
MCLYPSSSQIVITVLFHNTPYTIYHISHTIYHIPYTIYHISHTIYHIPYTIHPHPLHLFRLEQPGLQCLDLIVHEMQRMINQSDLLEWQRFPDLKDKTMEVNTCVFVPLLHCYAPYTICNTPCTIHNL